MSDGKGRMTQYNTPGQLPQRPQKNPIPFKIYWVDRSERLFAINWHKLHTRKSQYGHPDTFSVEQEQQFELNELTQSQRVITPFKRRLRALLNHLLRIGQIVRKQDLDIHRGPLARKCFQFTHKETVTYEARISTHENIGVAEAVKEEALRITPGLPHPTGQYTSEERTVAQILTSCLQINEPRGSSTKQVDTGYHISVN